MLRTRLTSLLVAVFFSTVLAGGPSSAQDKDDLPDVQYYGYKIVHHMTAVVKHIETFGFNTFDQPASCAG